VIDNRSYLHHLVELEVHERRRRRIERNLRQSELPADKTLATLKRSPEFELALAGRSDNAGLGVVAPNLLPLSGPSNTQVSARSGAA
jgi:hypothetical protein